LVLAGPTVRSRQLNRKGRGRQATRAVPRMGAWEIGIDISRRRRAGRLAPFNIGKPAVKEKEVGTCA